jgi:hypothetical protein
MRHLVLYKLAGFFPTDWQPIGRELCPQKRCQKCAFSCTNWSKLHAFRLGKCKKGGFLQGGGATFWQAKNGGFWGPGGRADARAQDTFSFTFLVTKKTNSDVSRLCMKQVIEKTAREVLRTHRSVEIYNGNVIDIRSLPKGRSLFISFLIICYHLFYFCVFCPAQRG